MQPRHFEARVNLGLALEQLGDPEGALVAYRDAQGLRPGAQDLCLNIGAALQRLGRYGEAAENYRNALQQRPAHARLLHNLGTALQAMGEDAEAVVSFAAALDRDPGAADTAHRLGDALLALGRWGEAMDAYRQALAAGPAQAQAWSALLMLQLYSDRVSLDEIRAAHARFAERFEAPVRPRQGVFRNAPEPGRRLRIGYVSADLWSQHPVPCFLEPVLAGHDHDEFEVTCYHTGAVEDQVTARLRSGCDAWHACARMSDEQLAARIRADGIDLLIDLNGHTAGNRLLAFARRPAPVQLSWIGYPEPTGLRAIDYFLTDALAAPADGTGHADTAIHPDRCYRLPTVFNCYRPPAEATVPAPLAGEAAGALTFGSFNNATKISDTTVRLWAQLMAALPSARLVLKDSRFGSATFRGALLGRFGGHGVDPGRLTLLGRSRDTAEHFAQYGAIDIALDTYPYGGVTTTCDALWMGVPVVSLAGDRSAARMGLTLLDAAGHPEWVARTEAEYLERARALAGDTAQRQWLRRESRTALRGRPLLDEAGHVRTIEAAYRAMWHRWCETPA